MIQAHEIEPLLEKAQEALRKDLNHISIEVCQKKLSASSSRDLVAYIKLLSETLTDTLENAKSLTSASTEALEAIAKTLLNETQPKSNPTGTESKK